ncbi:MAG: LysR family transcriptional regulator [Zoogloeaceae bacterium]|nr:LysR family transcriptional regulator [Rhodocyclaceae bacterium]MCP5240317.1 LysR family transcriptional regulator [Zoogloeaceae bacterium]MCP5253574.1 LysR family transcriptional regulator [Zoogloeaceae bacterium]MCP5294892.1 LysR family transcriptional regulator [Zoogloeaceae bacterium]MCW5616983.1 LysR family transcriptional regulator [Rhodocyclaceae bacterium]
MHALAAFEAAARLGGFGQAAGELCITPSAVSHRIRQLEALLEIQLFERTPSGTRLTGEGGRYLESVREAFDKLASASGRVAAEKERLRVLVPPTFARQMLMPRLPEFLRLHPEIELAVNIAVPMANVSAESADVEVRWGDGNYPEWKVSRLFDDTVTPLAAPAFGAMKGVLVPADLRRVALLRTELLPWKGWFEAAGLDWEEPLRGTVLNDLGMLLEVAAQGLGVALCTRRIAAGWVESGRLSPLFDLRAPAPFSYYLVASPLSAKRAAVADFIDWLEQSMA